MNVKVLLPGHSKSDAIRFKNAKAAVDDDGILIVTKHDDDSVELGRFELFQSYWVE